MSKTVWLKISTMLCLCATLSACLTYVKSERLDDKRDGNRQGAGSSTSFDDIKDSGPDKDYDVSHIPDAIPMVEPITRAGNRSPYTVLGKTYQIDFDTDGFTQEGYASWYGKKFHGRKTSNGEVYDMYGMTAAHKTLPIPVFVKVINLENGREAIVRVNDRGPFHSDRIIDLSYTAAKKLGFQRKGTARVKIETIDPLAYQQPVPTAGVVSSASDPNKPKAPTPKLVAGYVLPQNTYLQVGAFSQQASAQQVSSRLAGLVKQPIKVSAEGTPRLFKVLIGPIHDNVELALLRNHLEKNGVSRGHIVEK